MVRSPKRPTRQSGSPAPAGGRSKESSLLRQDDPRPKRLLRFLRRLAQKERRDAPQIFLSIRDAAHRFGVSISQMAAVYHQLKEEGILSSIRGSRTILTGRARSRALNVRGYVGMPALLSRFLTDQEYRSFFLATRSELHTGGFATHTLYLEKRAVTSTFMASALKLQKVDTVVWLLPAGLSFDTALRLKDKAIGFVGVSTTELPEAGCHYQVRRANAITAIIRNWHAEKIRSVTILHHGDATTVDETRLKRLHVLVTAQQLSCEIFTFRGPRVGHLLASLAAARDRGVIITASVASLLSCRASDSLNELLRTCRVALIDGPVSVPFGEVPPVLVDLVTVDWKLAAKRIVTDLLNRTILQSTDPVIFEAEHFLRVPLAQYTYQI